MPARRRRRLIPVPLPPSPTDDTLFADIRALIDARRQEYLAHAESLQQVLAQFQPPARRGRPPLPRS